MTIKKIILFLLCIPFAASAQDSLRVKINAIESYNKIIVYNVVGANQKYLASATLADDEFNMILPENTEKGMYRIYFSNNGYFDFLYNNESVSVAFDASNPEATAVFEVSEENIIYQDYLNKIEDQQSRLDSIQYSYLNEMDINLKSSYQQELENLYQLQNDFEIASENLLAHAFIKSNERYYNPEIVESMAGYYQLMKTHFFDYIDFSNPDLLASSFYIDKAVEYIFYLNGSEEPEMDQLLKREAIITAMNAIGANYAAKKEVLHSLMFAFATQENIELLKMLRDDYYKALPQDLIDDDFLNEINGMLQLAVGALAPEIVWNEDGEEQKLSELTTSEQYILVFWSTGCSHCLEEIPELYKITNENEDLHVIAIALEESSEEFEKLSGNMPNWTHVLGLEKWENEYALTYQIASTPTYFILDKNKVITAKPYDFFELKDYFQSN